MKRVRSLCILSIHLVMRCFAYALSALALLLALSAAARASCADEPLSALTAHSRSLCETSERCRRRFYMREQDPLLFSYLVEQMLSERALNVSVVHALTCDGTHDDMWLLYLESMHFCTENELPDVAGGCVCRRNKVCHETPSDKYVINSATYIVLLLALIVVVFYYGITLTRAILLLHE